MALYRERQDDNMRSVYHFCFSLMLLVILWFDVMGVFNCLYRANKIGLDDFYWTTSLLGRFLGLESKKGKISCRPRSDDNAINQSMLI